MLILHLLNPIKSPSRIINLYLKSHSPHKPRVASLSSQGLAKCMLYEVAMARSTSRCSSSSPLLDSHESGSYSSFGMADSLPGRYPYWFPTFVPKNSNLISALLVFSSCITSTVGIATLDVSSPLLILQTFGYDGSML